MNMFEMQERLKDFSKDQLVQEMQMPSGTAPPFLVLTELQRRTRMEQAMKADGQGAPQSTVAEDAVASAGVPQGGLQQMAQALAPRTDMTGNTGAAPVQQMAEGGSLSDDAKARRGFGRTSYLSGLVNPGGSGTSGDGRLSRMRAALESRNRDRLQEYEDYFNTRSTETGYIFPFPEAVNPVDAAIDAIQRYRGGDHVGAALEAASIPPGGALPSAAIRAIAPEIYELFVPVSEDEGSVDEMAEGGEVRSTGAQVQSVIDQVMGGGSTSPVVPQIMSFADRAAQLPVMAPPQAVQPQMPQTAPTGGMPDMSGMEVGELAGIMNSAPDRTTREAALEAMKAAQGPSGGFNDPSGKGISGLILGLAGKHNDPNDSYIKNPQAEGYRGGRDPQGRAEGGVIRYQEGGRVDVPEKVATDRAVIAMANRMGMSVQEYLDNLDPEARRQFVRNVEKRENMDLSEDDAAYDAFMDRTQNYLELPSQEDLDNRFSRQQQDERFGFSNIPSQMQPPAEGAGLTGISDMRSYREQLRDMGRQSVAPGARLQPPTMQSPLPAERFATMSTEGSVGPYIMPEMVDDYRAARTRAAMDSPLLGSRAGEVMPDPGLRDDERAARGFGRTSYMSGLMEPADSPGFLSEGASSIFDYIPDVNAGINAITDFASPYRLADSISRAREELATTDDPNVRRGLESQISSMESLIGASEALGENVIAPATDAVTDAGALAMRAVSNPLLRGAGRVASTFSPGVGGAILGLADTASETADRLALTGQVEDSGTAVDMAAEAERSAEEVADLRDEAGITQSLPSPATRAAPSGPSGGGGGGVGGGGAGGVGTPANAPMSDNERMLNQDKWLSLARVGLGLMSSQAPTFGQALGEAGAAGLDSLTKAREDYLERKQTEEMMAMRRAALSARGAGGGGGDGVYDPLGGIDTDMGRRLETLNSRAERLQLELDMLGEAPRTGFLGFGGPDAEWTKAEEELRRELTETLNARDNLERALGIGVLGGSVAPAATEAPYSITDVR